MKIIKAIVKNIKVPNFYSVYLFDGTYLDLSIKKDSNKITSQWAEGCSFSDGELDLAANSPDLMVTKEEKLINFFDLPHSIQRHIIKKIRNPRTRKNK